MANYYAGPGSSRSPPPLQHPIPTHPLNVPEPPATPVSGQGYQRFTTSPPAPSQYPVPQNAPFYQPFPAGSSSSHVHPMQQPQQPPQPGMGYGNNQYAGGGMWGVNDATAQIGLQLGQNAVAAGQEYMQKNFGLTGNQLVMVKHHFNVSNSYVLHKLRVILFPWRHKPWARRALKTENGVTEWQPPRDDINSPDLYIPAMSIVTYVLLSAVQSGLTGRFKPEILGMTLSRALGVVAFEFLFVKLGCYLLNISGQSPVMDLVAYGGYKFVSIIPILLATFAKLGRTLYWLVFLYSFCTTAFFLLRSLRYVVLPNPADTGNSSTLTQAQRGRRIGFLFIVAMTQLIYILVLVNI